MPCIHRHSPTPLIAIFIVLLFSLLLLLQMGIIGIAFKRLGFSSIYALVLLLLSLFGSAVNIPVKSIVSKVPLASAGEVMFFGFRYIVPPLIVEKRTVLAVNIGGAVIPVCVSLFLLPKVDILTALTGVLVMTVIVHMFARPIEGFGIAVPALLPPVFAALTAFLISPANTRPLVAYISGTMGSLIGADILNLKKIPSLGAPMASIGGAGTFDGIFLTGILSVILT